MQVYKRGNNIRNPIQIINMAAKRKAVKGPVKKRARRPRKPRPFKAGSVSEISAKLDRLEMKIDRLRRQQDSLEDDVEESVDSTEDTEKDVQSLEKDMDKVEKDIDKIEASVDKMEKSLFQIGKFSVGREHFMELARGTAGAFLGVGVGLGIRWMPGIAENLEWANAVSILSFIMIIGAVLIYKNEKEWIAKQGNWFVPKRLIHLFIISLGVEVIALYMFNMMPADIDTAIKTLIVGSYPAMSGAITFTIT